MRFPFNLSLATGRWIAQNRRKIKRLTKLAKAGDLSAAAELKIAERFATTLMLEPTHRCNLRCRGCGRIREYGETLNLETPLGECLRAVDECGAPIVSVCGGEPLIYSKIVDLIDGILRRGKFIYLCTNGLLISEKLSQILALQNNALKKRLYWSVHLDGPRDLHDALAGRPGTFDAAFSGLVAAKKAGFRVYVNATIYRSTPLESFLELAEKLRAVKVDGTMLSPAFRFDSVEKEEKADGADDAFLNRDEIVSFFEKVRGRANRYRLTATPAFFDFLCGKKTLKCAAWGNPTRNVRGWRSPCYLIADKHCATYRELLESTDWEKIGADFDPRCRDCMTHCGFEPASVLQTRGFGAWTRLVCWYFSK